MIAVDPTTQPKEQPASAILEELSYLAAGGRGSVKIADVEAFLAESPKYQVPKRKSAGFEAPASAADIRTLSENGALGSSGVLRDRSGRPQWDHLREMRSVRSRGLYNEHGVFHEMLSDPILGGVDAMITRKISRPNLRFKRFPNLTDAEKEALDLAAAFTGLDGTPGMIKGGLRQALYHGALSKRYGMSVCEQTWDVVRWRGRVLRVPGGLHWRAPWSIERILWHGDNVVGVQQIVQDDSALNVGPTGSRQDGMAGTWRRVVIPANRLIIWTHQNTTGNPEGQSYFRAAYRYWQLTMNTLRRIERAEEMQWSGISILKELEGKDGQKHPATSQKDVQLYGDAFDKMRQGLVSYLVNVRGWDLEHHWPTYELNDRTSYLEWLNFQKLMTMSAALFGLQASNATTKALAGGIGQILYDAIADFTADILETFNGVYGVSTSGVLRDLIDANIPTHEGFRYPQLEETGTKHQDLQVFADALTKLYQFRAMTPGAVDEEWVREVAGAPKLSLDEIAQARAASDEATRVSEEGTQQDQAPQAGPTVGDM